MAIHLKYGLFTIIVMFLCLVRFSIEIESMIGILIK